MPPAQFPNLSPTPVSNKEVNRVIKKSNKLNIIKLKNGKSVALFSKKENTFQLMQSG